MPVSSKFNDRGELEAAGSLFSPQEDPQITNDNHNNESWAWQAKNQVPDYGAYEKCSRHEAEQVPAGWNGLQGGDGTKAGEAEKRGRQRGP